MQKKRLSIWIQAVRPFAFSASVIPVLLGGATAFFFSQRADWYLLPVAMLCAILFHSGTNLINEYYDFKRGVDRKETFGSSRVLVDNLEKPEVILQLGVTFFIIGILFSGFLISVRGFGLFLFMLVGLIGGFFYTGGPRGYKYLALGDILVFLLMGPVMVIGSYFTLTGTYRVEAFYFSLPVGLLVVAILSVNNMRDIRHDRQAGIWTLENIVGFERAKIGNILLLIGAYLSVLLMIAVRILPFWSFSILLSLPLGLRSMRVILASNQDNSFTLMHADRQNAQLHLFFGLLLILSLVFGKILR